MITSHFQLGDAMEHRGIVVTPLFPRRDPVASYVTLDEALPQGLKITEISEAGSVPELVVQNPLEERVLLYDSEELVGAKQNRILNVSVLVGAKTALKIPVSCVEQGRWSRVSRSFSAGSHVSHAQLRRRKAETQAARPMEPGVAQGVVWRELHTRMSAMSVDSPTGASRDLYRAREQELRAIEAAFPAVPGQCGAVLGLGADLCVDLVSRPDAFARLWPKLRAGYVLDALSRGENDTTPAEAIDAFVASVGSTPTTRQESVGLGEDVRLRGERVIGSGLELDGEIIQLSAFSSEDGGQRAFGRIARPSARR
jgi:hypothetical protein